MTKGTDDTVAEGTEDTIAPATQPRADSGIRTNKVGDAIKGANIQAFDVTQRTRYQVLGELARGGLGRVLRARDPRTGRIVALKEILHHNAETLARFAREALVTANLQHPSIVPVYEVGRWPDGEPFYAMKLVNGRTLNDVIARARTAEERVALLPHAIAVADALAYAHGEQVIHRDLKPNNVLVGPYGETVVIDWGLARNIATGEEVGALTNPSIDLGTETVLGTVMGTPAYMPPEQAHGAPLDEGADVYAIGAILYHMLAGQRPYADAPSIEQIVNRVKDGPPRPLSELAPGAPKELVAIVEKAMARKLEERYRTAVFLAEDLRRFQSGKLVGAHQYTSWELTKRWLDKHRALITVGIFAFAALIAVGIVSVKRIARERDVAAAERATAQQAEQLANERFEGSLEELARQAALAGSPERAIAFLAHVHHATASAGILRSQAQAAFANLVASTPAPLKNGQVAELTRDGARLYVAGGDGKLIAWADQKIAWTADGVTMELSPDEKSLLVATGTKAVLHDAATGAIQKTWDLGEPVDLVRWRGARFAIGGDKGAVAIATPTGELVAQPKHDGRVRALAWRGEQLASAGDDGVVHVAGKSFTDAKGALWALEWVDDTHLIAGGADHLARRWNVTTGRVEQTFDHGVDIYGMVLGKTWLATYGDGPGLRVWPLAGGPARELVGHRLALNNGIAIGDTLITADETGEVYAWDALTGGRLRALPYEGLVNSLIARGPFLVEAGEGPTRIWRFDPEANVHRARGATARIRELAIAGDTLWLTANDGTARSFALTGAPKQTLGEPDFSEPGATGPEDPAMRAAPNPHGARVIVPRGDKIYVGYEDGRLLVAGGEWKGHTGRIRALVFSPDGTRAYTAGDTTIRAWDVASGKQLAVQDLGVIAWAIALHGDTVVALDDKNQLSLWTKDLVPGPMVAAGEDRLHELQFIGDRLLVANAERLGLLELATGKLAATTEQLLAFSASVVGDLLAIGDSHGEIVLYDARTLTRIRNWRSGDSLVTVARLRPDGKVLATAANKHVVLWDVATGSKLAELPALPTMVLHLAWTDDGAHLAISGAANDAWIWDLAPRAEVDATCATTWELADAALRLAPAPTAWCQKL